MCGVIRGIGVFVKLSICAWPACKHQSERQAKQLCLKMPFFYFPWKQWPASGRVRTCSMLHTVQCSTSKAAQLAGHVFKGYVSAQVSLQLDRVTIYLSIMSSIEHGHMYMLPH